MIRVPPPSLRTPELAAFVRRVEAAARLAGRLTLTSWYRDPRSNAAVGGAPRSRHLTGRAIDVIAASPIRAAAAFRAFGLRVIDEKDHLHIDG